jgi:hypothetical protein
MDESNFYGSKHSRIRIHQSCGVIEEQVDNSQNELLPEKEVSDVDEIESEDEITQIRFSR